MRVGIEDGEAWCGAEQSLRLRVALFGLFGVGNFGNEASLAAALAYLRQRYTSDTLDVLCICARPAQVSADHGVRATSFSVDHVERHTGASFWNLGRVRGFRAVENWRYALRTLKNIDIFVLPGTGIFDDFGEGPLGMPFAVLRWCAAARLRGAKVVLLNVGAGPVHHPLSRLLTKCAAGLAQYRSYRDIGSKTFMTAIGLDTSQDKVEPDLVFSMATQDRDIDTDCNVTKSVAIGIMSYYGWRNDSKLGSGIHDKYLQNLVELTIWLLEKGLVVQIIVGEDSDHETGNELISAVHERIGSQTDRLKPGTGINSFQSLVDRVASVDVVIATRFHNVVAALMAKRPVISIGYAGKNDELLEQMGMSDYCQRIEELDMDRLKNQFEALVRNRTQLAQRIAIKTAAYRCSLAKQFDELLMDSASMMAEESR